jgi:C-terminal processing protease CtpA/Prc
MRAIALLVLLLLAFESSAAPADDSGATGSGIRVTRLSPEQIQGLHLLGRVWGFLKYHHPHVTSGKIPWDVELLRIVPRVLDARDSAEVESRIVEWIDSLGAVSPCRPCAELSHSRLQLAPRREWLDDRKVAGDALLQRLRTILANRTPHRQFYVSLQPGAGNPSFDNEPDYARVPLPDAGFQLLGLFRLWSAIEYWFPYRSLIDGDWTEILREFIPRIAAASTRNDYQLEMMALIARIGDGHANLWSSMALRPPAGACRLSANVRFIEGLAVVTGYSGSPGPFQLGDVLVQLDGASVREQIERWRPYYAGSNDGARLRDIGRSMTRGQCGATKVIVKREEHEHELQAERVPANSLNLRSADSNDLAGATFRMLSSGVAYLKVSAIKAAEISANIEAARDTQAIIVDLRGYPSDFVVFKLGGHFVARETAFARFAMPDLSNPGAFNWTEPVSLKPEQPYYGGKLFVLVDENTQSQAEYTAMSLRAAPHSTIVGSATAGADGNVSRLPLPGSLWSLISGFGVYYPDKRPTQRVGIEPDLAARPTVSGIRQGQDEVLAVTLRQVISGDGAEKQIADLSKRPQ